MSTLSDALALPSSLSRTAVLHNHRLDGVRRHLFKFLAATWRPAGDARESACEVIHVRSGTPVSSITIDDKHTPASVAQWAVDECVEFARDCGESHAQNFHVVFDQARHSIWIYPEGGDNSLTSNDAFVEQLIRHDENRESRLSEMWQSTLEYQADIVKSLTSQNEKDRAALADFMRGQVQQMELYKQLMDASHQRELEKMRAERGEARKQILADRFVATLDKAGEIGLSALASKVQSKMSEGSVIDQLAAKLEPDEQKVLALLIRRAVARAQGEAPTAPAAPSPASAPAVAPAPPAPPTAPTPAPPTEPTGEVELPASLFDDFEP